MLSKTWGRADEREQRMRKIAPIANKNKGEKKVRKKHSHPNPNPKQADTSAYRHSFLSRVVELSRWSFVDRRPCPMVQTFVHSSSPGSTLTEPDFSSLRKESFTSIGFVFSRLDYISCYKQKEIKHASLLLSLIPQVQERRSHIPDPMSFSPPHQMDPLASTDTPLPRYYGWDLSAPLAPSEPLIWRGAEHSTLLAPPKELHALNWMKQAPDPRRSVGLDRIAHPRFQNWVNSTWVRLTWI